MNPQQQLHKQVEQQARRMKQAEQDKPTLIGQTIYVGMLGLLFVLPVIGGAYLGLWLDDMSSGYSVRWTISLILLGVFIGLFNVYYFIKE
ncbi:MAG: AtpZ/AtpI family protein [Gammaproteobacteria bacterium]|nr:AtpZ/AtpI family protein [Gammaproteobacteria bacterium]